MATSKSFESCLDVDPVAQVPGLSRRTLVWGNDMLLAEMSMVKGTRMPKHNHVHEQIGYLAKGRLEFLIGDERKLIEAGSGYVVPSNVLHEVYALEDSVAIDIFSPVREEYLR